jgi:Fe-S cluster assembly scaffold protein SufB
VWRYSRVADLDLDHYSPGGPGAAASVDLQPTTEGYAGRIVVVDGVLARADLSADLVIAGVFAGRLVDHPDAEALLGSVLVEPTDVFARLNDAFTVDPIAIVVPPGVTVEQPIVVEHVSTRADLAVFPRIVVGAGEQLGAPCSLAAFGRCTRTRAAPVVELR